MEPADTGPTGRENVGETPLHDLVEQFLDAKAKTRGDGDRSGAYVRQLEGSLTKWLNWMQKRGVETIDDVDSRIVATWAKQYLTKRVQAYEGDSDNGVSRGTAWTYYNHVSAFLAYCRDWEYIDDNPAQAAVVEKAMPDRPDRSASDQQFWSPEQRQTLLSHVDERAREVIHADDCDPRTEVRDRALCYLIGYSGVRGAEVLSSADDNRDGRNGATWGDIDLEHGTIDVLGKSQSEEQAPLTSKPLPALRRWRDVLDPATKDWPLFPTFHAPTQWGTFRDGLVDRGYSGEQIDDRIGEFEDVFAACREFEIVPPALSTAGGRRLVKRLGAEAGVNTDDDPKDHLTLHGARRGAGEMYYRNESASAAQRALRHADPTTTSEMYAHIEASELSDVGDQVFDDE